MAPKFNQEEFEAFASGLGKAIIKNFPQILEFASKKGKPAFDAAIGYLFIQMMNVPYGQLIVYPNGKKETLQTTPYVFAGNLYGKICGIESLVKELYEEQIGHPPEGAEDDEDDDPEEFEEEDDEV